MNSSVKLLKDHKLRNTSCREEVLDFFLEKDAALSHSDLESQLSDSFDRVTLYRTLKTFLDAGLIHKVLDDEGGAKYALCKSHCTDHHHLDNHVHFKCMNCGKTSCLDSITIPSVSLPKGYEGTDVYLLVQGVCRICGEKN
ncbi:Fur family transcriptional regulator [Xanthocytophaga agilis]|uniref:Transcriptional repressor n=1 Tax=Xanthocytophaga agilis TaxID=3048010 RepID=A0AAE3UJ98_9BACT|nr:transcriptional repressor [Xanthocytophaga agilis]MDJ1506521.1 transcriptional repressor [Xanthocytophaga agilis]